MSNLWHVLRFHRSNESILYIALLETTFQTAGMMEDIRLATGIDLRMGDAKKKKKKKKTTTRESGLTELGIEENTARKRLEKKLLNR